jgi:hypothetical protein
MTAGLLATKSGSGSASPPGRRGPLRSVGRGYAKNFSQRDMSILTPAKAIYTHGGGTPFPNEGLSI